RPTLSERTYRLPGDKLDSWELWLLSVEDKKPLQVEAGKLDFGMPRPRWTKDSKRFTWVETDRGHARCRLLEADAATGKTRTVFEEKSPTRLVRAKQHITYVDDGKEIIWASERDGWNHLYLIDGTTGAVKNQITKGRYVVRAVEKVDEEKRQVWYTASGVDPKQDPYLVHAYRIDLAGNNHAALTAGDGTHVVAYSPDRKYLIDNWSRVDLAPVTELRRAVDGSIVCELEKADVSSLSEAGWKAPEVFVAKGRDGETDIWGVVF